MARASSSLPVPLSPVISTRASVPATMCAWASFSSISGAARDDLGAPVLVRGAEAGDAQRLLHLVEQLLLVDRLGEEAERAHLRRLHRIRNGAVRGEDDDLQSRPAVLQLLEQPDAVHLVHAQVGDDEIGTEAAGGRERLRAALHRLDVVALRAQADGQQAQQPRVVIDHENARFAFAGLIQGVLVHRFGLHRESSRLASFVARFALVQRALDVGDGVELGVRLVELLAQPGVLVRLGLQAVVGGRHALAVGAHSLSSAACDFPPPASNGRQFAAVPGTRARAPPAAASPGWP